MKTKIIGITSTTFSSEESAKRRCSEVAGGPFFLLHAAKMQSSCEEGSGQSALQSAYHNPKLDVTELKQNRTSYCSGQKLQANKLIKANYGRSRSKDSTMDPLKKLVPSSLSRPVKQQGLTHAC